MRSHWTRAIGALGSGDGQNMCLQALISDWVDEESAVRTGSEMDGGELIIEGDS